MEWLHNTCINTIHGKAVVHGCTINPEVLQCLFSKTFEKDSAKVETSGK